MANLTSAINIQVDSDTKKQATDILNNLGLSMSTAINIFLKQVIKRDGIPFEIVNNKPNEEMLKAVQEVKEMISHPNDYPRYTNREDLKKALLLDNVDKIAKMEKLERKFKNHKLVNDKYYIDCFECHIDPDWLLIYKYNENELILLLVNIGSHSEVF